MAGPVRKRFGQHFLVDVAVVDRIFDTLNIRATDEVLEIGPGRGELTGELSQRTKFLEAVELDRDLTPDLRRMFPNVSVTEADVLTLHDSRFIGKRIVGNLPYEISTSLITRLLDVDDVKDMHFMLQREVAERLVATPGTKAYGRLSVVVQYRSNVSMLFEVNRESFAPPPKVESAFVRIQPKIRDGSSPSLTDLNRILRLAFSQRRKTLKNSLKSLELDWEKLEVDTQQRADQTSLVEYLTITRSVNA